MSTEPIHKTGWVILDPFGPDYPALPAVKKFRAKSRRGLKDLSDDDRRAYGSTVGESIRNLQRSELRRGLPPADPRPTGCASGTWHTDGDAIHEAVRQQQRNALLTYPAKVRVERTPKQWAAMYEAAMKDKRSTS